MNRSWLQSRTAWLGLGLVLGLVIGGLWPQSQAHAVATDRFENFAMCTGPVDDGLEALFVLDFLTGELRGYVLSIQNGKFNSFYTRNIVADLGVAGQQNPRYLMVTGLAKLPARGTGLQRAAMSMLYVAEITSGQVAAYTIPWAGNAGAGGQVVTSGFIPIDKVQFRNQQLIRDPGAGANSANVPAPKR